MGDKFTGGPGQLCRNLVECLKNKFDHEINSKTYQVI